MWNDKEENQSNEMDDFSKLLKESEERKKDAPLVEEAMRHSFVFINSMGLENFIDPAQVPYTVAKKIKIIQNMILWFSMPQREEYEVCAELKLILDRLIEIENI